MSTLSLKSAIKSCTTNQSLASKDHSDRFFNPNIMVCPVWNGLDSAGRPACPDSVMTKSRGCNSAQDRVLVENGARPSYMTYINTLSSGDANDHYHLAQSGQFGLATNIKSLLNINCQNEQS